MRWLAAVLAIAVEVACDGSSPSSVDTCQSVSPAGCPPGRCASVLAAALRQCSEIGGGVVQLAGGTYHLNDSNISSGGPMIALNGLSNVSVVGSADHLRPSLLLIHGSQSGLQLTESRAITLANLELDMARCPYTFGTATAVTNTSFELVYAATQYPFASQADAPWQYEASSIMGFDTQQWRMANDPVVDLQGSFKLMPVKARNNASSTDRIVVNGAGAHQGIVTGNSFVLRHRQLGCGGFCFASCRNVHMRNVKVWTAAGVAVWFGFSRDITLQHVEVRRRQGRPMSSIADASHFDSCGGQVLIEANHFEGQGDDGMNIHSTMHEVRAVDSNISGRFWLGSKPSAGLGALSPLTVGGSYTFRNRKTWAIEAKARLRAVSLQNSSNATIAGHLPPGVLQQVADFTFVSHGDAAHVSRFAMLSDQSMEPSAVIVRGGYFGSNRARGALLKSSNTLVENTVFNHTAAHCIQAYPDGCWWFEGDAFANWTLRNNTFLGCGAEATQADVFVAACAPTWNAGQPLETPSTGGPVREGHPFANVTVVGNVFLQDTPHVALQLFGSDGLRLVNNTVECVACGQLESGGRHNYNYEHAKTATARASAPRSVVQNKRNQIQPSSVSGHLDSVDLAPSGGILSGWVVDPALSFPGPVSSNVTLIVDGVPVLRALASLPRPDLVPKIAAQPQHGFQIKLTRELARNLLSLKRGANHTISMSALRSTNGTQHVFSTACVGAYRPTCGLPPDWRGVHPSSCLCETPWPPRIQISNSIRCQVKHNICDGSVCGGDASGCGEC